MFTSFALLKGQVVLLKGHVLANLLTLPALVPEQTQQALGPFDPPKKNKGRPSSCILYDGVHKVLRLGTQQINPLVFLIPTVVGFVLVLLLIGHRIHKFRYKVMNSLVWIVAILLLGGGFVAFITTLIPGKNPCA